MSDDAQKVHGNVTATYPPRLTTAKAKEIVASGEWEGDLRVNMTSVIGAGRVLAKRIERLEAINAELLEALVDVRESGSNINLPAIEAAIANAHNHRGKRNET